MDSVVGDDLTLPVDINGSCRLPDSIDAGEYSTGSMTAPSFPDKTSPIKALTMKDYENQITALKKENFNLKLRIYFMEDRMQQKCDDSTEDIFKTNIELRVDLESMKRELAEKQELLVSASKALESLAGRDPGDPHRVREQAQRDMDALRDAFNKRTADLEQCLRMAEGEVERMASIAEQEKLKNIDMEKQLQALCPPSTFTPSPVPDRDLQQALQDKDDIIRELQVTLKSQEAASHQETGAPSADRVEELCDVIAKKDQELQALRKELHREADRATPDPQLLRCISKHHVSIPTGSHIPVLKRLNPGLSLRYKRRSRDTEMESLHELTEEFADEYAAVSLKQSDVIRLESSNKMLTEELTQANNTSETLTKALEEAQNHSKNLLGNLEERENELNTEKKNALKRDKTIQGLTLVLREKEKEIAELCHEIEDRDDALAKAREAAHKAQLQKYQGVEEHQNVLMEKQTELAQLQGAHHAKVLEAQKLQRALDRKEQELNDLQQAKDQLEVELEDLQLQKKKGDKAQNELNNQLKKLGDEIAERESALTQQYQELLDQTQRKLNSREVTIQRLTSSLTDKEQQLQEYINMVRDFEQSKSPGGNDDLLSKLRRRLKDKEAALEQALDAGFAAIEDKDNEIHLLQLSLRERERDLDRLNNLLSHNEDTVNSFDSLIKEKDLELQHLANTLKNLQRAKQDVEDNLNRSLREKDSIISQLQRSLEGKTKDMDEMAELMMSQSQTHARDFAEQMGQRLKVTEVMLAEAVKARERLVVDNESAVEGLLATVSSKDQLLKESAEHYNRMLSERTQEIQDLRKQLSASRQQIVGAEKQSCTAAQEGFVATAELRALLAEKDGVIDKLLQRGQDRDRFLAEMRQKEEPGQVLELRQTIRIMQEKLDERETELSRRNSEDNVENIPVSKKAVVLKRELAQKTEALNKALKRENELMMALAELQSLLSELEGRSEGQAANVESLTATLKTKDEIIRVLHQHLGQRGDRRVDLTQDQVFGFGIDGSIPGLPQRERTMIGGDSQQEALPNLLALQQEHDALNKALRAEQQLYSSLVRTVKEQDCAQRLHALQLELTAVQLLRQQLEESVKTNEELRDDLEREIHRAKLGEGMDLIDAKELESMRHQLEDAQRWNASLQARLGAIQNRGGGVGGASDGGETLSFLGDQTSYMSICVGAGQDDSLSLLSAQELRQKVLELQDCVGRLQSVNDELQNRLSLLEKSEDDPLSEEVRDVAGSSSREQQLAKMTRVKSSHPSGQDKGSQTGVSRGQVSGKLTVDGSMDSGLGQMAPDGGDTSDTGDKDLKPMNSDVMMLRSLLTDCGAASISHLRELLLSLRSENMDLRGLLKEQESTECKEKASAEASGNSSDGQNEWRKSAVSAEAEQQALGLSGEATAVSTELTISTTDPEATCKPQPRRMEQSVARLRAGSKSRLPVPVRLRVELASGGGPTQMHLHLDDVCGSEQQLQTNPPGSLQRSTSPSSTFRDAPCSGGPAGSDEDPEAEAPPDHTRYDAALLAQLELLHQECQEKDALVSRLSEQLAGCEELHAQLKEKERLNSRYTEALQAAESTIAYLTACSLGGQGGVASSTGPGSAASDAALNSKALQEEEALAKQEPRASSHTGTADFCLTMETASQQENQPSGRRSSGAAGSAVSMQELQRHADSLQEALWDQNRINAELQSFKEQQSEASDNVRANQQITDALSSCFSAAESVVASLAAHCTNTASSDRPSRSGADVQMNLDKLKTSLQERKALTEPTQSSMTGGNRSVSSSATNGQIHLELHNNLCCLYEVFGEKCQRISDLQASLQEEKVRKQESPDQRAVREARGLPPSVQVQLETLHKALREKKKACKSLEEKLASALTNTSSPEPARKVLEQDEKGVQVDMQDLGYETSGKSENDREESSSTDLEGGVKPSCSTSSLPSLLKHEHAAFSSTENLDSASSTPYPSSPALSSAKVSLKSLQVYDEFGVSEDPLKLQGQVRELKVQLENQTKIILQMQNLLRRSSLSSDLAASASDPATVRDQDLKEGKIQAMRVELERERTLSRRMSEQLQHACSRSASPARLDSLVQSQARELSQLRQQIKDSRRLGALQRRQLEELSCVFKELLRGGQVDFHVGEVVKEQLDKSLGILDRLEGRLDKGEPHLDNEEVGALELTRRLSKELQEKNRLIQSLQTQLRGQSGPPSAHSDLQRSDGGTAHGRLQHPDWTGAAVPPVGGANEDATRLQGLQRENGRLQEQLRSSADLNASLRSELHLQHSVMAQTGSQQQEPDPGSGPGAELPAERPHAMNSGLLGEHLQEIRALRQRLEESIRTNDRLREQLEKRVAGVGTDPAATNIFIHGEEQSQLANEMRLLWGQNQILKDQLNVESRDRQKENEKLRETLARRSAKLEQSRKECDALRQESRRLQEELHGLQVEVRLQREQLSDSQHLLRSLRVELQVHETMKTGAHQHNESCEAPQEPVSGPVDLGELLLEIRRLRLQLERSIQTNTALRQKLEEQLLRGETININYLLSPDGGRSPGRDGSNPLPHSLQNDPTDENRGAPSEADGGSVSSSSGDSVSAPPPRLVPGHRLWASHNGRHFLGLMEDFGALRKQISDGRKLSRRIAKQLQACLQAFRQQGSDSTVLQEQHLQGLSGSAGAMQHVLEETGRLLKLVWRVSLPAGDTGGGGGNNQQDELLNNEIARLKSRLSQQERMLSGTVKRLRTTNQLKEGMERVIVDQLCLTHGVLQKARGNLETNYCSLFGLKGPSGGADEGGSGLWPVGGAADKAEEPNSEASSHCSY
ncbi:CDK5 regulatory subunit-associated protein 2 [Brachionichthys hirsutus]|uniref:CDK5 regulatory subunit-associated protein 2 n=1 Tax=Brachionichthys hirsutus TaxID=412623 RepID=UPI0036048900